MNYSRRKKIERPLDVGVKKRSEAGQAVALLAVVLLTLTMAAGLAVDMGYLRYERRRAQMAADSAAIAGASCNGTLNCTTTVSEEGITSASYNGFAPNGSQTTVNVQPSPSSGPHAGDANYVEATITQKTPVFFMKILGSAFSSYTISARAVATLQAGKSCVYTTGSLSLFGGLASDCVVDVGSDLNFLGVDNSSFYLDTYGATYAGNFTYTGDVGATNPNPVKGGAVADPLPNLTNGTGPAKVQPPATCGGDANGPFNYCAGYYSGGLTIKNWNANFEPGTYVFGGPLQILGNGNLVTGTGVTFYMANGSAVYINYGPTNQYQFANNFLTIGYNCPATDNVQSGAVVQLSAPTDSSNPYAGVLLIQPVSNNNAANIMLNNGDTCQGSEASFQNNAPLTQAPTQASYMWGVMDMPSASVTLFGQGLEADGYCSSVPMFTTVIANTLEVDGHVSFGVTDCSPNSPGSPAIYTYPFTIPDPLKDAVLVE